MSPTNPWNYSATPATIGAARVQGGKLVAFASSALTKAEQQYAQIGKELLAIVYGVERFHQFTYGRL